MESVSTASTVPGLSPTTDQMKTKEFGDLRDWFPDDAPAYNPGGINDKHQPGKKFAQKWQDLQRLDMWGGPQPTSGLQRNPSDIPNPIAEWVYRYHGPMKEITAKEIEVLFSLPMGMVQSYIEKIKKNPIKRESLFNLMRVREYLSTTCPEPFVLSFAAIGAIMTVVPNDRFCSGCKRKTQLSEHSKCKDCGRVGLCQLCTAAGRTSKPVRTAKQRRRQHKREKKKDQFHTQAQCNSYRHNIETMVIPYLRGGFRRCLHCNAERTDTLCKGCEIAMYCNVECQKADFYVIVEQSLLTHLRATSQQKDKKENEKEKDGKTAAASDAPSLMKGPHQSECMAFQRRFIKYSDGVAAARAHLQQNAEATAGRVTIAAMSTDNGQSVPSAAGSVSASASASDRSSHSLGMSSITADG